MAAYFLDSSALGKNYHTELGTAVVEGLLKEPGARHFISRLTVIEIQSVFARKVRTGVITEADFQLLRRRFLTDVTKRQFHVVRMSGLHYQAAEQLITQHGTGQSVRTLDALRLSVALHLRREKMLDYFVCADKNLCTVARVEGLSVINPEQV
ncbi:MAG: type II toxin-antitoxin system VapC family toxin [Deltaproteobacteria bacterium]|nr:type II toxin-antitoxin system VapC family toxin [Deltaproteobacteria bacterium]